MKKRQQRQILDLLETIRDAQTNGFYADCQEGAVAVGEYVESIRGEGTRTVTLLEEYCVLLFKAHNGEAGKSSLKKHLVKIENSVRDELKPDFEIDVLPLYYFNHPNFGDALNSILIKNLFGIKEVVCADIAQSDMVAIGSVLGVYFDSLHNISMKERVGREKAVHVWGTGLMHDSGVPLKPLRPLHIHALRGMLTKDFVEKSTGAKIDCPLADPGLLASKLLTKSYRKKYDLGIIPHYIENDEGIFKEIRSKYPNSVIIDITANPIDFISTVAQCECIISSALHGLIAADSLSVPNLWCRVTEKVLGSGFKFRDYYSSYGLPAVYFDASRDDIPSIGEIINSYKVPAEMVLEKQEQLIASFPF